MADYDWNDITKRRRAGEEWPPIASDYGVTPGTIRKAYSRHRGRAQDAPAIASPSSVEQEPGPERTPKADDGVPEPDYEEVWVVRTTATRVR